MTMMLAGADLELLQRPAFAALAVRLPGGALQNTIMWYRVDQDTLRMIAPAASAKARALQRSPQVAVAIHDPDNSYDYLEIRGHAEVVADDAAARAELREIAGRYIGERAGAYVAALSDAPRVLIVVRPDRVRRHRGAPVPAAG
ncbi:MAG TPA: TIGR03618 family F420-dependent PPOX class oxidoreductase [Thermomicrobiales bacterium]|nr:TIGR03618 family F420-dependent PPOX class oxidoreductase [Thermomicrobiales bacterium]